MTFSATDLQTQTYEGRHVLFTEPLVSILSFQYNNIVLVLLVFVVR